MGNPGRCSNRPNRDFEISNGIFYLKMVAMGFEAIIIIIIGFRATKCTGSVSI